VYFHIIIKIILLERVPEIEDTIKGVDEFWVTSGTMDGSGVAACRTNLDRLELGSIRGKIHHENSPFFDVLRRS